MIIRSPSFLTLMLTATVVPSAYVPENDGIRLLASAHASLGAITTEAKAKDGLHGFSTVESTGTQLRRVRPVHNI
mgnify:CR=1 FL=1